MTDLIKILEDKNISNQAKVLYAYLKATLKEDDKYIYSVTFAKKLGWKTYTNFPVFL